MQLLRQFHRDERGVLTAWFIGISIILFGFLALSFDIGLLHLQRRAAQNAADPAALAGAAYLPGCRFAGEVDPPTTTPVTVAKYWAHRNLGAVGTFADDLPVQAAQGTFRIPAGDDEVVWPTVKVRVTRNQGYIFGRAFGLTSTNVPAEAEAVCAAIEDGGICPLFILADPSKGIVRDEDGNLVSAYGIEVGRVYPMRDSESQLGSLVPPTGTGSNSLLNFLGRGCQGPPPNNVTMSTGAGALETNEPGAYGNPFQGMLNGGAGPAGSNPLFAYERTSSNYPHGHLSCNLKLTLTSGSNPQVATVEDYVNGQPTGVPLSPAEVVAAINAKTDPALMAPGSAPCGGVDADGNVVPEANPGVVHGRFMHIALVTPEGGTCSFPPSNRCDVKILGIARMYVACWTEQQGPQINNGNRCIPNPTGNRHSLWGVFADFSAPSLHSGGGIGTNPLAPKHVVLVK